MSLVNRCICGAEMLGHEKHVCLLSKHDEDDTYDCDGCGKPYPMDEVRLVRSGQGQTTQCGRCLGW
jgi:hypothetical protein